MLDEGITLMKLFKGIHTRLAAMLEDGVDHLTQFNMLEDGVDHLTRPFAMYSV